MFSGGPRIKSHPQWVEPKMSLLNVDLCMDVSGVQTLLRLSPGCPATTNDQVVRTQGPASPVLGVHPPWDSADGVSAPDCTASPFLSSATPNAHRSPLQLLVLLSTSVCLCVSVCTYVRPLTGAAFPWEVEGGSLEGGSGGEKKRRKKED